jgi:hypothetical protein
LPGSEEGVWEREEAGGSREKSPKYMNKWIKKNSINIFKLCFLWKQILDWKEQLFQWWKKCMYTIFWVIKILSWLLNCVVYRYYHMQPW